MKTKLLSVCLFVFLFSIIFLLLGCPPVDKPPKLTIPDKTVDEGQVLQFDLKQYAEDKDKNTLVFTIVSGVGEIVGSDYRYAPTFDDSGEKEVKIRVTNAKGKSAEDTFKITVNDVNRPPVLDIPDQTIDEGETLTLDLNDYADDPDGDDLTFALVSGVGDISVATYTYTPDYDVLKKVREYNQAAESVDFEVSISANDGKGGEATATFTIRVTDVNRPPVLDIPDQTIDEGETLTLNLLDYTTDPDTLDTFTYTLLSGVGNIAGSTYTYTATYTDAGTKTVTVRATDNKGGTGDCTFKITVNDVNRPPALDIPDQTIDEGETLTLNLLDYTTDPDTLDTFTYTILSGVGNIVGSTYTYSATYTDSGIKAINIRVTDNKGCTNECEFSITVNDVNTEWTIEITRTDSGSSFVIIEYDIIPERQPNMIVVVNRSLNNVDFSKMYTLSSDSTQVVDTNVLPDKTYFYDLQLLSDNKLLHNAKTSVTTAEEAEVTYETSEFTGRVELPKGIDSTTLVVRNMDKVAPLDTEGNFEIDVKGDQVSVMFCSVPGYKIPLMTVVSPEVNETHLQSTLEMSKETTAKSLLILNPLLATPFPDSMARVNEAIEACSYLQTMADLIERLNDGESEVEDELIGTIESALDEIIEYLNEYYPMEEISPSGASSVQIKLSLVDAQGVGTRENIYVDLERVELSYTLEEIGGKTYYEVTPKIPGKWISVISIVMLSEITETLTVEEMETFDHTRSIGSYITGWPQRGTAQSEPPYYGWINFIGKLIDLGVDAVFDYFLGEGKTSNLLIPAWEEGNYAFSSYGGFADTSEFGIFTEDLWETFQDMKEGEDIGYSALPNELASFFTMVALNGLDVGLTVISTIFNISGLTEGDFIADVAEAIPEALRKGVLAAGFEYRGDLQDISKWVKFMKEYIKTISVESFRALSKAAIKLGVGLIIDVGEEFLKYAAVIPKVLAIASNASEVLARITSMVGFVSPRELAFITVSQETQLPVVTKVSGPNGDVSESTSTFSWTGNAPGGTITKYEYRKDGGSWVNHGLNTSYTWSGYSEGPHKFEVRAQDNDSLYSNTITWDFQYTAPGPEKPPVVPFDPHPEDNSQSQPMSLTLVWDCYDPNGDPVTYDVYFEKQMNTSHKVPTKKIGTEIPEKSFAVGPLLETTTYLWQIVAYDSKGNKTTGPVWKFKTGRKPNNPPEEPSDPSPANNSTKQTIRPTLRWKCTDPDGDGIDYELYFGTTTNPPKVLDKPDDGNSYYEMKKSLEYDTQYYWKVVATDRPEYGDPASSAGPLWTFRTAKKGEPGTVEWEVQFSNEGYIWGEIAILSNGARIVPGGQNDPRIYAFTPSGSLLWTYDAESFITAGPVVSIEDSIYIGTVDGTIHSIESNGEVRWKYKAPEQITKALPALGLDGTVYFAVGAFRTLEKGLYALHPNGEIKWIFTSDGWITSGISIGPDGTIYFGCADWFLYAVNQDGTIRWKYETGEYVRGTPAIGDDGTIYFGSQDGYLYAITANSKLIWRYKTYNGYPDICDPVIDKNGNIYIRASEYFHCVGPDGKKKWVYTFDFTTCENIAIGDDGIIYIANKFAGQITAFNSKGNVLWYLNLPPVDTSPTISDGMMNIATVDGVLHAINVSSYSLADSSWPKFGRDLRNTGCMIEPYPNNPPDTPRNPTPEHNSPEQPLSITLGWECSDPDYDFLKYDVFFGKQPNPMTKVSGDIKDNECQIDNLEPETTYYWKVNAKDGRDGVTSSPVWSFTTKSGNDVTTYFYEGFETGDLLSNQWVVSGDYLPAVQSQEVFDGNYALSFLPPFASENQIVTSSIEITVTLPTDAFISFYRKVSGRSGDWLDFYIDSNLVGQWSALEDPEFYSGMQELEWGEVVRRIPAGTHTLEWTYTALRKTLTESSDNSWIDEIRIVDIMDLGDVVLFPDSRLDTFVKAAIGKQNAEEIRSREVQDISIIVIVNDQPLEGLSVRREVDLVPREVIERMEGISLTESNIPVDFSGIEYLKDLIVLAVIDNAVEDITPLKNCEKLFAIIFSSPYITPALNISDISPISSLKNLRMLLLQSGSVDLSGLKNSSSLVTLLLDSLQIENVGTISDLKQLIYLSIVDCGIQDVQSIEGLVDLIVLLLSSNQISDISQLAELVKLEELYLNRNNITDISALVANNGLDSGDLVDLRYNELDLDLSSDNMSNIQTLLDRGVEVLYLPQNTNLPPTVTKLSGPNGDVSESTSAFSWTGNAPDGEVVKYEYRKDEGNWIDHGLNTSYTWSGYAEGPHKFEVRAQDNDEQYSEAVEWNFTYSTGTVVVGEMVLVEGGTFMMGDEFGDLWDGCRPVHQVTLTYDFWLGKYEVTFDEYDAFCNATGRSKPGDSGWGRGQRPVIWVSWWDAIAYCNWLSEKNGLPKAYDNSGNLLDASGKVTTDITKVLGYRLPTEAEWEYAARGGKHRSPYKYSGSDNVDIVAWYSYNSGGRTHEVGQKLPNALGIYDMSGNVWEWCSDWWYYYTETPKTNPYNSTAGSDRVLRGGSWYLGSPSVRVASRYNFSPTRTFSFLGFRICRTVP